MKGPTKSACNLDQGLPGHFHGWTGDDGGEHWLLWRFRQRWTLSSISISSPGHQSRVQAVLFDPSWSRMSLIELLQHLWSTNLWNNDSSSPKKTPSLWWEFHPFRPVSSQRFFCNSQSRRPSMLSKLEYSRKNWISLSPCLDVLCSDCHLIHLL